MGASAFSVHVQSEESAVAAALDTILRRQGYEPTPEAAAAGQERPIRGFWLAEAQEGWVSLLDSARGFGEPLAQELSTELATAGLHTFVADSDDWGYALYQKGTKVSAFASKPDKPADSAATGRQQPGAKPAARFAAVQEQLARLQQTLNAAMPPDIAAIHAKRLSGTATAEEQRHYGAWMAEAFSRAAAEAFPQDMLGSRDHPPGASTVAEPPECDLARAEELRPVLPQGTDVRELARVFGRRDLFAEDTLAEFLRLLGLRPEYANLRYDHLRGGADAAGLPPLPRLRHLAFRLAAAQRP